MVMIRNFIGKLVELGFMRVTLKQILVTLSQTCLLFVCFFLLLLSNLLLFLLYFSFNSLNSLSLLNIPHVVYPHCSCKYLRKKIH